MVCCLISLSITCGASDAADPLSNMFEDKIEPTFKSGKDSEAYMLRSMLNVQRAVEFYASHHRGQFPSAVDVAFKSYLPFGEADDQNFSPMSAPYNPLSHKREWPVLGKFKSIAQAKSKTDHIQPGTIEYAPVEKKDYVIRMGDSSGHPLAESGGKGEVVVFSHSEKEALIANTRTVEWAAERYAEDHENKFPALIDDLFKSYFPGGDSIKKIVGNPLPNPCSHKLEWPILGKIADIARARIKMPDPMPPGQVEYTALSGGTNYAIRAGACSGKALANKGKNLNTYVLAKDGDGTKSGWH